MSSDEEDQLDEALVDGVDLDFDDDVDSAADMSTALI